VPRGLCGNVRFISSTGEFLVKIGQHLPKLHCMCKTAVACFLTHSVSRPCGYLVQL